MNELDTRRAFLVRSAGFATAAVSIALLPTASRATPQMMQDAIRKIVGETTLQRGRVMIDVPPLVENGNAVPVTVSIDSPMTEADRVVAMHIVNEKNPQPHVISASLGPRIGRARLTTRIKLADSQRIVAIAEMKDGSFWSESADVVVTLAACIEDVN
jgi:sulfur-oxidizing protein SoxY